MAIRNLKLVTVRFVVAGAIAIAACAGVAIGQSNLQTGVPVRTPRVPVRTTLFRQPRPASAPTGSDGHAVVLKGTIEPCQPRPTNAPPRRLDAISAMLAE
ncbi:MAG: hypothetical protein JSS49_03650 [Planctomycetes bacterium]|nr:hypothetical protein [Planctomycetota bacterium]